MDTFIKLPTGQVNKRYADERVLGGLNSGLYKEVDESGKSVLVGEPTVLSSANGKKNFEAKIQPSIDRANQNIANTNARIANKEATPLPEKEEILPADIQAELNATKTPEELLFEKQSESIDRRIKQVKDTFSSLSLAATAAAQSQINSLTSQWNQRRGAIERSNKDNLRGWESILGRMGVSRYTPGRSEDFLTLKEQEGIERLAEIDSEYNTKVAAINSALEKNLFSEAATLTKELNLLEDKSLEYMKDLVKESSETNKKIKEKQIQASRDRAISGLLNQGVTDPAEIMDILAESAEASGYTSDFTAEEIEKTLKALTTGGKDWQDKLSGATRDFYILKEQGQLPSSVTSLPEDMQLFAYLKQEKLASSIGSGGAGNKVTLSEVISLRKSGLDVPLSLAGMSQEEFDKSLTQASAPKWFIEKLQNELQQSVIPEAAQEAWEEYKKTEVGALGTKEDQSNDYKKARSYFESTYDGLSEDELDQLANEVERRVNGGLSYADAITEVEDELK